MSDIEYKEGLGSGTLITVKLDQLNQLLKEHEEQQAKLAAKDERIEGLLEAAIASVSRDHANALAAKDAEIERLGVLLDERDSLIGGLTATMNNFADRCATLEAALSGEMTASANEVGESDARIAAIEARNEQLEAEVGLLRTPADEALTHLRKKYETSIAALEAQLAERDAEIERLKAELDRVRGGKE